MGFELPFVIGPEYIAVALFGVVIGIIFGAIPGMRPPWPWPCSSP